MKPTQTTRLRVKNNKQTSETIISESNNQGSINVTRNNINGKQTEFDARYTMNVYQSFSEEIDMK